MKTYKTTRTVEYWACMRNGHNHRSEDIAQKCIQRSLNSKTMITRCEAKVRSDSIVEDRLNRITYKVISKKHRISICRVMQIYSKAMRKAGIEQ